MKIAATFWSHTLAWAVGLALGFTVLSLGGEGLDEALRRFPAWLGLGLALGTFPAGIRLAAMVLPEAHRDHRALLHFTMNSVAASVAFLVLAGFVGPGLSGPPPANDVTTAARGMTLGELRTEMRAAAAAADPDGGLEPTTIEEWWRVNVLAWNYYSRLTGSLLPFLFAWLGAMAGFWIRFIPRPEVRAVLVLGLGLLLLVSTYLANENSFEWIVVQAAGPVPFAGLFALVVPGLLAAGLAWPTSIMQWRLPPR